jgi:hypothetical protein
MGDPSVGEISAFVWMGSVTVIQIPASLVAHRGIAIDNIGVTFNISHFSSFDRSGAVVRAILGRSCPGWGATCINISGNFYFESPHQKTIFTEIIPSNIQKSGFLHVFLKNPGIFPLFYNKTS